MMSSKTILTFLLVGLVAIKTINAEFGLTRADKIEGQCKTICPDIILSQDMLAGDVTLKNIALNGQPGCICLRNNTPDVWIMQGKHYGLCDRPVCLNIPKGKNNLPGQGQPCPPIILANPTETIGHYWTRVYEEQKNYAPEEGWCPKDKLKWIVYGSVIGKDRDTCTCVTNFQFMKN